MKKNNNDIILELEDLKSKHEILTQVIENSSDLLYRMSLPDGRYTYVSPASFKIFGYKPEVFYRSPVLIKNLMHPDWVEYFKEQWELLLDGSAPENYEYQIITPSGEVKWIFQKNVFIRNKSGKICAIEGIVSDVTERKELEEKLRKNAARLEEAQRLAQIGYWQWDIKTGDVEWSEGVFSIFQQDPDTFKPQIDSIMALSPWPEDHKREQELMKKAVQNHETGTYEQRFLLPDGQTGYYLSTFQGMYDKNDELIAMRGTVQDITSRKRYEEALRISESRFRELVEMLPEAIFETTIDLNIIFANQRAHDLFGYTREDLAAGLNGVDMIAPRDRSRLLDNMAKHLNGLNEGPREYTAQKKDGTTFPILFHAGPIIKDGEATGFRGILFDITEQKNVEMEKNRLEEQYRQAQKVESIGRLAGGVAHDLNNLLTPILGYSEILMEDLASDPLYEEPVEEINKAALGARELVSQLLAFGRKQTLEYKTLDMNKIVKGVEKLLHHTIREDIDIKISVSDTPQTIKADIVQMEQVILNMAINARDAMPDGGILTIETDTVIHDESYVKKHFGVKTGAFVMLAISDTGCGMDEETRVKIFEPFFSTKGKQGTGLGLATVYGTVKQHGGNIFVYSEPGKGTTFKVYLPFHGDIPLDSLKSKTDVQYRNRGSETILLAEDNKKVRTFTQRILKEQGYKVLEAVDGNNALELLDSYEGVVHLLLTDVIMPGMNGRDLYKKASLKRPDLKVLYMSGYTDAVIDHHGILEEGLSFIQKPFSLDKFSAKIREVLGQA